MLIVYDSSCAEYCYKGHPEKPFRVIETAKFLREQQDLKIEWAEPFIANEKQILRAHLPEHLKNVKTGNWSDADTPVQPKMFEYAMHSTGGALRAMESALNGIHAFSLMRPPGHHAEKNRVMGFCHFNHAAICALEALERGVKKIAVFDFDVHHGNGTEDILRDCERAAYVSVHEFPCYPGTGQRSYDRIHNFPVLPSSPAEKFMQSSKNAIDAVRQWSPDLLIVSAGFDSYKRDPLASQSMDLADFQKIGEWVTELKIPHFAILEGGYSKDLPKCVYAYLRGAGGEYHSKTPFL